MKVKATLLTILLGLTSLVACGKSIAAPSDVEDWDTPEETLAFANYHVTPSVSCSGFFETIYCTRRGKMVTRTKTGCILYHVE